MTQPAARLPQDREDIPTVIDAGSTFEGVLTFRGAVRVDGQLTGKIVADGCLVIGPRAKVAATIEVDELVVAGEFEGDATARARLELLASSRATGRLRAPCFALAEGCRFDGSVETLAPGAALEPVASRPAETGPGTAPEHASAP
jgi:cytoskeletal protein CcmA (bactofilin family)